MDTKYNLKADIIRSISIILVIILHTYSATIGKFDPYLGLNWWISVIIESITKVAVPIFIMLSGLLILDKEKIYSSSTHFYKKRISKIGIPIIFWTLFYYTCFTLFSNKTFNINEFFNNFIFLNIFYHLYFLFIILGLYIITPLLKVYLKQINKSEERNILIYLFLYSIFIIIFTYFIPTRFSYWSIFFVFIPFISYYLSGNYFKDIKLTTNQYKLILGIYIAILAVTVISKFYAWNISYDLNNTRIFTYFSDAVSINVVLLSIITFIILLNSSWIFKIQSNQFSKKIIPNFASYSFGVYLIHPIVIYVLNIVIPTIDNAITPLILLIKSVLVITISYLIIFTCNKLKFLRILFGL